MTKHLMNPVNRQYFMVAARGGISSRSCFMHGSLDHEPTHFQGVTTGVHSAFGHFSMFWTVVESDT
jgi:hypothetical protein